MLINIENMTETEKKEYIERKKKQKEEDRKYDWRRYIKSIRDKRITDEMCREMFTNLVDYLGNRDILPAEEIEDTIQALIRRWEPRDW